MKVKSLAVHWHQDSVPIYGAQFQPNGSRLATAGGDKNVLLWRLPSATLEVEYLSTLMYHEQAVNAVAWSPNGEWLASAGDDGLVCLWHLSEASQDVAGSEDKETWRMVRRCRSSGGEIYDLAWSPSGKYVAAAAMDNALRVFDVATGQMVHQLNHHSHYVQGVSWDPSGKYLATQSSDRSLLVYPTVESAHELLVKKPYVRMSRCELPNGRVAVYHNETFQSFFRRLAFSPDGGLLITPAAQTRENNPTATALAAANSCLLMFSRYDAFTKPVAVIPVAKQCLCVRFSPLRFELRGDKDNAPGDADNTHVSLPYRLVYAVALQNTVVFYDTEQLAPLGQVSNLHYSPLTDLAWSPDGRELLVTSIDGFCTVISFDIAADLGSIYTGPELSEPAPVAPAPAAPAIAITQPTVHTLVARKRTK